MKTVYQVSQKFSTETILELIKEQTGLKLELCDCFTGIREHNGRKYFNVILPQRTSESKEYDILRRFAEKYKLISVEPNGLKRVAVFQITSRHFKPIYKPFKKNYENVNHLIF